MLLLLSVSNMMMDSRESQHQKVFDMNPTRISLRRKSKHEEFEFLCLHQKVYYIHLLHREYMKKL